MNRCPHWGSRSLYDTTRLYGGTGTAWPPTSPLHHKIPPRPKQDWPNAPTYYLHCIFSLSHVNKWFPIFPTNSGNPARLFQQSSRVSRQSVGWLPFAFLIRIQCEAKHEVPLITPSTNREIWHSGHTSQLYSGSNHDSLILPDTTDELLHAILRQITPSVTIMHSPSSFTETYKL